MNRLLSGLAAGGDGIYSSPFFGSGQAQEIALRRQVAQTAQVDLLSEISIHHSIEVMDHEVRRFVASIAHGGIIIDVGGCWGWHWRNIGHMRPDLTIIIMDIVRENLQKAYELLGPLIGKNIHLVHGDACKMPFDPESFDGYWSVQTLQHIEDFHGIVTEGWRILKPGGTFATYSLNTQKPIQLLYRLLGKSYHVKGSVEGRFYLERASRSQQLKVAEIFRAPVGIRYSEILFKPELNFHRPGQLHSQLGRIDAQVSGTFPLLGLFARQMSFHTVKRGPEADV